MDSDTESLGVGRKLLWITLSLFIAWAVLKLFKILKRILMVCNELILFWNMVGISRTDGRKLQLHPYVCQTKDLDEVTMNELYRFFKSDFASTGTVQDLTVTVNSYSHILLCRSKVDGSLRGVSLFGIKYHLGYTTLNLGLFLFKNHFKGTGFIYIMPGLLVVKELLKHPLTPVFVVGKAHAYKSYLASMKFLESYPRYNLETPPMFKNVFDNYAEAYLKMRPTAKYYPDRFVIETEFVHVAENLQALSEYDLQNPHIKYFVEKNPGWTKGHCLITAAKLDLKGLVYGMLMGIKKAVSRSKKIRSKISYAGESEGPQRRASTKPVVSKRRLIKRYTFQDMTANSYATDFFEMDMGGYFMLADAPCPTKLTHRNGSISSSSTSPAELDVDLSSFEF